MAVCIFPNLIFFPQSKLKYNSYDNKLLQYYYLNSINSI